MEYAFRSHKDVPFGWALALGQLFAPKRERTRRAAPHGRASGGLA
ncbi:hypothetical protein [Caulobacter sp. 17J80-11]|nr:hypothetical protein [Caulobacter sp. 17J80-11]